MQVRCQGPGCDVVFEAKRAAAKYHGERCKKRAQRQGAKVSRAASPQPPAAGGGNAEQAEQTLSELRRLGRIENIDAAAVQALRSMARALDDDPAHAALWRQYREALRELTADDDSGSVDAALHNLFAEVGDAPPS